jgi:hypothetical protein
LKNLALFFFPSLSHNFLFSFFCSFFFAGFECGLKLTHKTQTTKNGEVWCSAHIPKDSCDQGLDMKTAGALAAPEPMMGGRSISEKGGGKGATIDGSASFIEGPQTVPKPPTTVNNVNKMESRNQSVARFS